MRYNECAESEREPGGIVPVSPVFRATHILKFPLYYSDRATMFALLLYAAQIARKTQTHRKEPKMSLELLIENLLAYAK